MYSTVTPSPVRPGCTDGMSPAVSSAMLCRVSTDQRVRENRLRRLAHRQGLMARKVQRRDIRALDYGRWSLAWHDTGEVITDATGLTADELERYLLRDFATFHALVERMATEQGTPVSIPAAIRRYVTTTEQETTE